MTLLNTQKRYKPTYNQCVIPVFLAEEPPPWMCARGLAHAGYPISPSLPEIQLLYAMIERAWFDMTLTDSAIKREAIRWFLSEEDSSWTFQWVCDHLRLTSRFRNRVIQAAKEFRG